MGSSVTFGTPDYVVLAVTLGMSLVIGILFGVVGKNQNSQLEYLLGSRSLGLLPVWTSIFATFSSAISLLGIPAEIYSYGTMTLWNMVSYVIAYLVCTRTLLPLIYPLKITSIYQYFQLRFESRVVRLLGGILGMLSTLTYMTVTMLTPAIALQTVADLPLYISLLSIGTVGMIYTVLGGIRSVVWTDLFQTIIMFGGTITIFVKANIAVGGFGTVITRIHELGRTKMDIIDPDPRVRHTIWSLLFGGTSFQFALIFSQAFCQRLCSTKSAKISARATILTIPMQVVLVGMLAYTGISILVYFDFHECDPLAAGYIHSNNQLVPYFVIHVLAFAPGLAGFYISTIFAATLSTFSSGINAMAATAVEDLLSPYLRRYKDSTRTTIAKAVAAMFGTMVIGLAYLAKEIKGPVTQVVIMMKGITSGPSFGLFVLAATFPQANAVGAIVGVLVSLAFSFWLQVGQMLHGTFTPPLPPGSTEKCQRLPLNDTVVDGNGTARHFSAMRTTGEPYSRTMTNYSLATAMPTNFSSTRTPTINIFADREFSMYDLSYLWPNLIVTIMTVLVGLITSFAYEKLTGSKKRAKPEHLFPFARKIWTMALSAPRKDDEREEMELMANR